MSIEKRVLDEAAISVFSSTHCAIVVRLHRISDAVTSERATHPLYAQVRDVTRGGATFGSVDDVPEVVEGIVTFGNTSQLTLDRHV